MTLMKTKNLQDMKNTMTKWLSAIALISCFACSKAELGTDNATLVNENESGVFGAIDPIIDDDAVGTRSYVTTGWGYRYEEGERINIWSNTGSLLSFRVTKVMDGGKRAEFSNSGFTLTQGETYYATHPFVNDMEADYKALPITFEGQTQTLTSDGKLRDLAKYMYTWTSAPCEPALDGEGNQQSDEHGNPMTRTSFQFHYLPTFLQVNATLPKAMTVTEISIKADAAIFALNGLMNVEDGSFTLVGDKVNTLSMKSLNVQVSEDNKVVQAYFVNIPLPAAKYTIIIKDNAGKTYVSPEIDVDARTAGVRKTLNVTVESEERNYELVTSMPSDPAGKYILVYPNGTTYRAFSFAKTMENAETAAASVSDVAFADLYDQSSDLYNAVVGGNYVEITGEANATTLTLNPEQEAAAALDIAANAAPWTVTAPAKDLQTTLTSGSYSMGVDHLVVDVASDGKADLVAAFNAPDAVAVMNSLRGHDVNVTFQDLINLAITKNDEFTDDEAVIFTKAFNKLVAVVKKVVAENPHNLFPAGSTLMNITLSTNAFEVFSQYHDNVAELSWRISPEKRFGLAQLGYNVNAQGFTVSVNLPSHEWFNKLNESLTSSAVGFFPSRDKFVAYWAALDSQYTVSLDGVKIDDFFKKLATRFVAELRQGTSVIDSSDEFTQLYAAAVLGEFTKMGNAYKKLADKLNTGIQPAYIYKKVVE